MFLIRIPEVQTRITRIVANQLSEKLNTRIEVDRVHLRFLNGVGLKGIYIEDQQQDTLLYVGNMNANISFFSLFDRTIELQDVALENAFVNVYKPDSSEKFNFEFIINAFASDEAPPQNDNPWKFDLYYVSLNDIKGHFSDWESQIDLDFYANKIASNIETLGLESGLLQINEVLVNSLFLTYKKAGSAPTPAQAAPKQEKPSSGQFGLSVKRVDIHNSNFSFNPIDLNGTQKLNFDHFKLQNFNASLKDISFVEEHIGAELVSLQFIEEYSQFQLKDLHILAQLDSSTLSLQLEELLTANSAFSGSINVNIPDISSNDLLKDMIVTANFENDTISFRDASYFTDALDTLPQLKEANAVFHGALKLKDNGLRVQSFHVSSPNRLTLLVDGTLAPINNFDQATWVDINLSKLDVNPGFISGFLAEPGTIPLAVRRTNNIQLQGKLVGSTSDLSADISLGSSLGNISAHFNYKSLAQNLTYLNGNISTFNVDLAKIIENDSIGLLNSSSYFNVNIRDERIQIDTLNLTVYDFMFNNYAYDDIVVNGKLINDILTADLLYKDTNLDVDLFSVADLSNQQPEIYVRGDLNNINLLRLNLSTDSIRINTRLESRFKGTHPDSVTGFVRLDSTVLIRGSDYYRMDSLLLTAQNINDSIRNIDLNTDFLSLHLNGKFSFEELPVAINSIISQYNPQLSVDHLQLSNHQQITAEGRIFSEPDILHAYYPDIEISTPLTFDLSLDTTDSLILFNFNVPGIVYRENSVDSIYLNLATKNDHIQFNLKSGSIRAGQNFSIPNLLLSGTFDMDTLDFNFRLANLQDPSHFSLEGLTTFSNDTISLTFDDSKVSIDGKRWNLSDKTLIRYAPQFLFVDNFKFHRGSQEISVNTDVLDEVSRINLLINNINLKDFVPLTGYNEADLEGVLNADASITNIFDIEELQTKLSLYDIKINQVPAGNINLVANKPTHSPYMAVNMSLVNVNSFLNTTGRMNLDDDDDLLDLRVTLDNFQLDQWAVLIDEYLTDVTGTVNADMRIRGSVSNPKISGEIRFSDKVSFRPKALGTLYTIPDQRLRLSEKEIFLNRFILQDSLNNQAIINGRVRHESFQDMEFDLSINTSRFRFYNARRVDNPNYYGSVFGSANLSIKGPYQLLSIEGEIRSLDGTDFSLALIDEPAQAATASFINFIDPTAEESPPETEDSLLEGLNLNLVFGVTADSRFQIILDPMNGDNIVARGHADIRLRMSPTQELTLQGTYTVEEGSYSLTLLNIINKTFTVESGGTLTWSGPPEDVILDVTARYTIETSRYELVEDQADLMSTLEISAAKRREPVDVFISIKGEMLEPEINFRIEVPEQKTGATGNQVARAIEIINQDEAKLMKQAFGIIVMGRFIPTRGGLFAAGTGGGPVEGFQGQLDQSISQLLTQQLNRLSQEYLGGIEVSVDVAQRHHLERGATGLGDRDIGIQLSRSFFQERLRVMVGGTGDIGGGTATSPTGQSTSPAFIGEFEVLYRLDSRGNLNIRVFRTLNRNLYLLGLMEDMTGISISHQRTFNNFREFLRLEEEEEEAPPPPVPDPEIEIFDDE